MKSMGEMLLRREAFAEIVMGNTALVRAMVAAGTQVVTAYPGSPTPEIATAILSIPAERRPFYFEFSTNEKVATEVAYGASLNGHLSTVFFKSVGLNVAADTFVQLSLVNLMGGMVWCWATIREPTLPRTNKTTATMPNWRIRRSSSRPTWPRSTPFM
jgi:indolepyruvate ferredoxin oxidoreductase alpha subunit